MKGRSVPRRTARPLFLIVVFAAAGVTVAPAHAFTAPLGSDKGSITAAPVPGGDLP
jgi:hypothetical protein